MNARTLLRNRDVSRLLGAQMLSTLTFGVVAAALGWQAYERTGSPLTLGLIGLAEFLPALAPAALEEVLKGEATAPRQVRLAYVLALRRLKA